MAAPKKPAPGTLQVVDDVFKYTTKRGAQIDIDLDIPPEVFKKSQSDENASDEAQFAAVKEWLPEDVQASFDAMGALERTRFFNSFFAAFQEAAGLSLGESFSSSSS